MKSKFLFAALLMVAGTTIPTTNILAQGQVTQVPVPNDPNNNHGKDDKGVGNGGYDNGVTQAPFDAGLGILVAAGVGVGIRRAYKRRQKNRQEASQA